MAHHIERLLDIILSSDFANLIDEHGNPACPSADIYQKISDRMNHDIKPKYIYIIIKNNRYNVLDRVLQFHNIEIDNSFSALAANISTDDSFSKMELFEFTLLFLHKDWVIMWPEEVIYTDKSRGYKRYETLKRKVWSDKLYEAMYNKTKLPCPISFKRCKMSEGGRYLSVEGSCTECSCTFYGCVANKPTPQSDVSMECTLKNFDSTVVHKKKRQLKGKRRVDVSKALTDGKQLPSNWRRDEADKIMDFGDDVPAHLPNLATLRKAKQQQIDRNLGLTQGIDPIQSIVQMKFEQHAGSIHGVSIDPFFVHYWTPEQSATYTLFPQLIFIDATGSIVKKLRKANDELSPHPYLYQIVCETATMKMPVFQMLSSVQNTNAIQYWLFEILRIGSLHNKSFPHPREVISDFDKALMGAVSRAFCRCRDLRHYLSKCLCCILDTDENLPACFLRLDICHFVAFVARWKLFTTVHPRVKIFYITVICLLTKSTNFESYKDIVRSAIILCSSQGIGNTTDGVASLAEKARASVTQKIRGIPDPAETYNLKENSDIGDSLDKQKDDNDDDIELNNSPPIDCWARQFFEKCIEDAKEATIGVDINPYYCPELTAKIKYILPYFPLYTGVMIPRFGYGKINASSSAVESEFNDLKHRLLANTARPMRADKFITTHLRSFSGRAKLAVAQSNTYEPMDEKNDKDLVAEETADESEFVIQDTINNVESEYVIQDMSENVVNEYVSQDMCENIESENVSQDTSGNVSDSKTEVKFETNITDDKTEQNDQSIDSRSLQSDTIPAKITNKKRKEKSSHTDIPVDSKSELNQEQNWRKKNESKRPKRCYLDPRPDWDVVGFHNKRLSIGLLQNGNICPIIKEKDHRIVVANTCGFDSIMQILAAACRIDSYRELASSTCTEAFRFLGSFLKSGPTNQIYKLRADILRRIECFVERKRNNIIKIDALSNICNICEYIFHEDWSYIDEFHCNQCKNVQTSGKTIAPINTDTLNDTGYAGLAEALLQGSYLTRRCCKVECDTHITYGSQLFIECGGTNRSMSVEELPDSIHLGEKNYAFAGVVVYRGGTGIRSAGHYSAWVKNKDNWVEYDDLKPKPLCPPKDPNMKSPALCIYVKI